jgi:hypothetical protein
MAETFSILQILQPIIGLINPNYNINSRLMFESVLFSPMSIELKRPHKPGIQKNSIFNGKTIPYPSFEPRTSEIAVGCNEINII